MKGEEDIPVATNFNFLHPHLGIQTVREVVVQHWTVYMVMHGLQTFVDQETRQCESDEDANERNDGDPFLFGVFAV